MPSKVEAFKCDFCGKLLRREYTANSHEASCKNNPAKRHCITCVHGIRAVVGYTAVDKESYYDGGVEIYAPYCGHHNKAIKEQPYFIECDILGGFDTGLGWYPESPEPFSCWHYESKGKAEWTPHELYEAIMQERERSDDGQPCVEHGLPGSDAPAP